MNIASSDNPFTKIMYSLGCHILLNLYFILCCLPVITIGASVSAMNLVCYKMKEEPDVKVTSTFFKSFIKNIGDCILIWIILAGIGSMLAYAGIFLLKRGGQYDLVIFGVCVLLFLIVLFVATYIFLLLSKFKNDILIQIKNALFISVSNIGWTFLIWIIWAVPIFLSFFFFDVFRYFGWIWGMCGFSAITSITMNVYKHVLNKFKSDK